MVRVSSGASVKWCECQVVRVSSGASVKWCECCVGGSVVRWRGGVRRTDTSSTHNTCS